MNEYNSQYELIGVLANKSEYFNYISVKREYLDDPYDVMFEAMANSYEKHKMINIPEIMTNNKVDGNYFIEIVSSNIRTDENYLNSLEADILENWKRKQISNEHTRMVNKEIDVNQFLSNLRELDLVDGSAKSERYTKDNITDFLTKPNKNLIFSDFKMLQKYSKVKEHDFVVVAGKTGTGKTGFALNLMNDLSKHYPVLYINIELSESNITQRNIAMNTGIKMYDLDKPDLIPQSQLEKVKRYAESLDDRNIHIVTGSQDIDNIRRLVGRFNQDKHFIVIVDHIGRITNKGGKGLYEKATYNAIALRNLSLDYNCTIFGLSQLSREAVQSEYPSLNLLRDSGEVEQSARKVWFIWEKDKRYAIYIEKNDSGICGAVPVEYDKEIQKFRELETRG